MTTSTACPPLPVEANRKRKAVFRAALIVLLAMIALPGGPSEALENGTYDTVNLYKNVGTYMFTYGPNDLGLPVGVVASYCSGVLIHPRVFMTAAHCAQWNVHSVAPFLRMVVSFSHDNPRDPSTWIDITKHLVAPTWPGQDCAILTPADPPPCFGSSGDPLTSVSDIGLVMLSRPVTDIAPASLPTLDVLAGAIGSRMTVVGYGCVDRQEFRRTYGTSTLASVADQRAYYYYDPTVTCNGDSGGPTFFNDRVVSLHSAELTGYGSRARVDTQGALNWIAATIASLGPTPVDVVEFYNAALDHYFITWVPDEIAKLDAGTVIKGWSRTTKSFKAYTTPQPGTSPVCRYYIPPGLGDSHFFGRGTAECDSTGQKNPSFVLEDPAFMQMFLPNLGVCPANTTQVYRVFSNRLDANHRYMTNKAVRDQMAAMGWLVEGDGPDAVVMCAPQ